MTDALTQLPTSFPQIKAVVWFNWRIFEANRWWEWPIESSPSTQQAFRAGISSPYYVPGGTFGSLPLGSKIGPPCRSSRPETARTVAGSRDGDARHQLEGAPEQMGVSCG